MSNSPGKMTLRTTIQQGSQMSTNGIGDGAVGEMRRAALLLGSHGRHRSLLGNRMDWQQWPTDRNKPKPGRRKVQNPEGLVKEEAGGRRCLKPREELAPQGRQKVKWQTHQPGRGTPGLLCKLKSV